MIYVLLALAIGAAILIFWRRPSKRKKHKKR